MKKQHINFSGDSRIEVLPTAIAVFNFDIAQEDSLAGLVSSHPGLPVIFLSTRLNRDVFSQAEGRNRVFIFSTATIDPAEVDSTYPAQWLSPGDLLPALPGNLTVAATPSGFTLTPAQ